MIELLEPDWPAPPGVRAVSTTRGGGSSSAAYASFNLADHVGDTAADVARNRDLLNRTLALEHAPHWLQQDHGAVVVEAGGGSRRADASWSRQAGQACVVMTADCLPLLLCDARGTQVAACHAGWRGLHAGVIENTLAVFEPAADLLAWLGPAIGPRAFEVGAELVLAFLAKDARHQNAFNRRDSSHWMCDIYQLARNVLHAAGVTHVYGGGMCTFEDSARFYSYRRDGSCGRMASLIWLQ